MTSRGLFVCRAGTPPAAVSGSKGGVVLGLWRRGLGGLLAGATAVAAGCALLDTAVYGRPAWASSRVGGDSKAETTPCRSELDR
jgi:hypothetical protein